MVYNYTKPRGPIAAMYSSPGPAYSLPGLVGSREHDPRSIHPKGPCWAFGVRHGKYADDASPGPCYLPDSKVMRNGKTGTPQFSLYARPRDFNLFATPGPGAYCPESAPSNHQRHAPAYSFGARHKLRNTDNSPGPNLYTPDPMLGRTTRSDKKSAPVYSFVGRNKMGGFSEDLQKTPGPGAYSLTDPSVNKRRLPQYTITGRHPLPGDTTQKPGPGSYAPDNSSKSTKRTAPTYSFGIIHSQYRGGFITEADLGCDD